MASDREFSHLRPALSAPRWLFYRGLNICVLSLQSIYRQIGHMLDIIINIFIFICASLRVSRCMCCCLFRTATPSPSLSLSLTLSPLLHPPPPHHTTQTSCTGACRPAASKQDSNNKKFEKKYKENQPTIERAPKRALRSMLFAFGALRSLRKMLS